jgi:hypothetical protein
MNVKEQGITGNYTSFQFDEMVAKWDIRMYLTRPGTNEPIDANGEGFLSGPLTPDEIFDNILKKHAKAWKQLSEM